MVGKKTILSLLGFRLYFKGQAPAPNYLAKWNNISPTQISLKKGGPFPLLNHHAIIWPELYISSLLEDTKWVESILLKRTHLNGWKWLNNYCFNVKVWNHPTETTNKKRMFRVPGKNKKACANFLTNKNNQISVWMMTNVQSITLCEH